MSSSVDKEEIKRFSDLAEHWRDEEGPFKALHSLNKLRIPWILKNHSNRDGTLLDVGCGGGILSVPLARCGYNVTGIDAAEDGVVAAKRYMSYPSIQNSGLASRLKYNCTTIEEFARSNEKGFDVVVASEILEHVADIDSFVESCARATKTGGSLFFTTINRTLMSKVAAIWLAEDILRVVPQGVHEWEKFVKPSELTDCLDRYGCRVKSVGGFTYNLLKNEWDWTANSLVNYALVAEKIE
ncbi:unnamed protein product [Auanema sp. JU1783]|nr:unnamed protein product [Auanema sp. JU1783]